ncbi:MAG: hypothetical protein OXD48_10275, partial [Litoreibacter sp.]|nr:hypothetical protein [Litoreibacter sp.]
MSASFRYWRWRVLRQVPLAVFVAVLGGAATYYGNDLLPDRYTASTHLLVETPSVANDTALAAGPFHHTAQLQSIEARLMTNDRLTSLAKQLGRGAEPKELRDAISFDTSSGRGKPTSLVVSVTDADSAFAAAAANTLAEQVLAEHNLSKTNRAESALIFFREEVAEQKSRLDQAFAALLQFKDENAGALPEDASRYHDQRRALLLQRASKGLSVASDPFREQLELELRTASTLYSADHPRIRGLEAQLAQSEPLAQSDEPAQQISGDITQIDAALALIPANGLRLNA